MAANKPPKMQTFYFTVVYRKQRPSEESLPPGERGFPNWLHNDVNVRDINEHEARRTLLDRYLRSGYWVKEIDQNCCGA